MPLFNLSVYNTLSPFTDCDSLFKELQFTLNIIYVSSNLISMPLNCPTVLTPINSTLIRIQLLKIKNEMCLVSDIITCITS